MAQVEARNILILNWLSEIVPLATNQGVVGSNPAGRARFAAKLMAWEASSQAIFLGCPINGRLSHSARWMDSFWTSAIDEFGRPGVCVGQNRAGVFERFRVTRALGAQVVLGESLGHLRFPKHSVHKPLPHGLPPGAQPAVLGVALRRLGAVF